MFSIINLNKKVKIILLILFMPVICFVSVTTAQALFNFGTSVGTFMRTLYHIIVC